MALLLGACAGLPSRDPPPEPSKAIGLDANTALGRIALASTPDEALSGFRLMPLGFYSIDARVELARRAERSLDVQYYYFENDDTGRTLLRALRDAAQRGVRVRLLIDDLYTGGNDELFLAFAAYDNVEVRLFNPFCCARELGAPGALRSVAQRMVANQPPHAQQAVRRRRRDGGDRRAQRGQRILPAQRRVRTSSTSTPSRWASSCRRCSSCSTATGTAGRCYPIRAVTHSDLNPQAQREFFERWTAPARNAMPQSRPPYDVLGYGPISADLDYGHLDLIWGDARVFADHPDKPFDSEPGSVLAQTSVTYNLFEMIRTAQKEVVISSPYFVPGELSLEMFRELRARNVRVIVMTNSLASTDESVVHTGYARHRETLLNMGVDLYELSISRLQKNEREFLFGKSLGRLHAKLAVIDERWTFIGSMNLDPRSATINTELGALVDSPQLAREMLRVINIDRLQSTYRLRLTAAGHCCEWLGTDGEKETVLTEEPDSTAWLRIKAWLLSPFVPEEQL